MDSKEVQLENMAALRVEKDSVAAFTEWCKNKESAAWDRIFDASEKDNMAAVLAEITTLTQLKTLQSLRAQKFS